MITSASLKSHSVKDLGRLAQRYSVPGWKTLKKDQLIAAIAKTASSQAKKNTTTTHKKGKATLTAASAKNAQSAEAKSKKLGKLQIAASASQSAAKGKLAATKPKPTSSKARPDTRATADTKARPEKPVSLKAQVTQAAESKSAPPKSAEPKVKVEKPAKPRNPRILERIQKAKAEREGRKDLSRDPGNGYLPADPQNGHPRQAVSPSRVERDRIILMVRDAYWLHAYWEITRQSVQRAQAAMAEQWHTARPILRVIEVDAGATTSAAERVVREITVHGGVTNWYIDVPNPPRSFRVDLGYLAGNGRFYSLARSNVVATPNPGNVDEVDPHWTDVAEDFEKIYALSGGFSDDHTTGDLQDLFEEHLRRPMKSSSNSSFGPGAERALRRERDFHFEIDAEMLIHGQTKPGGHVTVGGAPVKVKPDGTFAVRLAMPDKRQVLPLVARSGDGVEHRTIVLAIERNTKIMEPMVKEVSE